MKKTVLLFAIAVMALASCGNNSSKKTAVTIETAPLDSIEIKYAPALEIGTLAENFTAQDTTGKDVSLSDFKGKYVVLDFWATWCKDCINELPVLKDLYQEYKDKKVAGADVEFVSVSFDDNEQAWKSFIVRENMEWHQISTLVKWKQNPISDLYKIGWIPTFYVIAPDGSIAGSAIKAFRIGEILAIQDAQ